MADAGEEGALEEVESAAPEQQQRTWDILARLAGPAGECANGKSNSQSLSARASRPVMCYQHASGAGRNTTSLWGR
jgi:hypothetical protein